MNLIGKTIEWQWEWESYNVTNRFVVEDQYEIEAEGQRVLLLFGHDEAEWLQLEQDADRSVYAMRVVKGLSGRNIVDTTVMCYFSGNGQNWWGKNIDSYVSKFMPLEGLFSISVSKIS